MSYTPHGFTNYGIAPSNDGYVSHPSLSASHNAWKVGCTSAIVVVFSGGQDSTTCLHWAIHHLAKGDAKRVLAVSYNYGQRHDLELQSAAKIAELAGVRHKVIDVGPILLGTSPLLKTSGNEVETYRDYNSLPGGLEKTFVPSRNQLFLTLAGNAGYVEADYNLNIALEAEAKQNEKQFGTRYSTVCAPSESEHAQYVDGLAVRGSTIHIVTGVCQEDFGGYPDCRSSFIDAQAEAISQALNRNVVIHAPLMNLTKRETVRLAHDLDVDHGTKTMLGLAYSHTCYSGAYPPCGQCHSCLLREKGFKQAGIADPLLHRAVWEQVKEGLDNGTLSLS